MLPASDILSCLVLFLVELLLKIKSFQHSGNTSLLLAALIILGQRCKWSSLFIASRASLFAPAGHFGATKSQLGYSTAASEFLVNAEQSQRRQLVLWESYALSEKAKGKNAKVM